MGNVEGKVLVDTLTDTLAQVEGENVRHKLAYVKAEELIETLAEMLRNAEAGTLSNFGGRDTAKQGV